ncbi:MAG: beta-ketoacyl-ACP synthase, partial [Victivallales bacterium]|nr:beta-ketoacyl-ACP synthase [Victivallales bacterium]
GSLSPRDIAFINAHGTGTLANDAAEAAVFSNVFGADVPFMSTKGRTGHTLGAAGAIEAIFTSAMLGRRMAARSWGFENRPDDFAAAPLREDIALDNPHYALSTSLAFGGSNTVLLLERCKP